MSTDRIASRVAATTACALAAVLAAGCIQAQTPPGDPIECTVDADCNTDRGEVCGDGVCWGDPPDATYAAVLGPASSYVGVATTTELAALRFAPDGWFDDGQNDGLRLNSAVRVTGQVRAACPAALEPCTGAFVVPGQLRWSRPSAIPGLPDVVTPVTMAGTNNGSSGGFEVFLPRPLTSTTYKVTFYPSTTPLGPALPSPASLLPPFQLAVTVGPADGADIVRDVMLPGAPRQLAGKVALDGSVTGWRVRAEAGDGTVQGAFLLASNIVTTGTDGSFTLSLVDGQDIVDLVFEPIGLAGAETEPPRARIRDHVVTSPLPATITLPRLGRLIAVPVSVDGTDGAGGQTTVSGASVVARLDQLIGSVYLQHQATATTASGLASVQLLLGTAAQPLSYQLDVLPGPTSELASVYGLDLEVADTVPSAMVHLPRGQAVVGTVLDEGGFGLPGATVTAAVSAVSLCELSSEDLRVARGLAPVQATTDAKGEFTLFLDPDFDGAPLAYDFTIEPAAGTWAPRWTFQAQAVTTEHRQLWLPAAAHVRARVMDPTGDPARDTVVTMYEVTDKVPPCPLGQSGKSGLSVRRAVATSDAQGILRTILPRLDLQ